MRTTKEINQIIETTLKNIAYKNARIKDYSEQIDKQLEYIKELYKEREKIKH